MIFSKLLSSYHDLDLSALSLEELSARIGSQLGEVEWTRDSGQAYDGAVVAKIVSCEKHPDADKLSVCFIDDNGSADAVDRNEKGHIQVVCGAPNVKEGLSVVWLAPGSIVPSTVGTDEEFELSAREIRGVVSNGMIASERELGISDEHEGIMELSPEDVLEELLTPGTPFKKLFGLDDWLIDIENKMFTHRPDCFGNLGITRELSGILGQKFESPEWYLKPVELDFSESDMKIELFNDIKDLCPRFATGFMDEIKMNKSPTYLRAYLKRIGSKSINTVVDHTNWIMMRTAQPTHAFDYDKVAALSSGDGAILGPRLAKKGEKLKLLGGKEIELTEHDLVIATDKQPVALAGIMGGEETEVDENTKRIIIEGATFDMYSIRRSTMRHGIFTDAATRFTKGQSPHQNEQVIKRIMYDLQHECSAKSVGYQEASSKLANNKTVSVSKDFINSRLGSSLSTKDISTMLSNVEFDVQVSQDNLKVLAPFWRMDIHIPEDIVEEVGRLYGYDNLPLELPKRSSKPAIVDELLTTKQKIRQVLSAAGANELLTYSFVDGQLIEKAQQDVKHSFTITNAISPELEYYRQSVQPSLLDKVYQNIRQGYNEFALYEVAKTHSTEMYGADNLPQELEVLGLVYVNNDPKSETAFYSAKKYVDELSRSLNLKVEYKLFEEDPDFDVTRPFDLSRSAQIFIQDKLVGIVGEFKQEVESAFKLPRQSAGFEMFTDSLTSGVSSSNYRALPDFPKSSQDITLVVSKDLSFAALESAVKHILVDSSLWYDYKITSIYSDNDKEKNVTFRITLADYKKTMTKDEVSQIISKVADYTKQHCGARQI